jgi:heme/copper-type cytochrome/quinol oxidase subunit 1
MRAQVARPNEDLLTPEANNQTFSMHGLTMIFLFVTPMLSGFANYFVRSRSAHGTGPSRA